MEKSYYSCQKCKTNVLAATDFGLQCANGHFYPYVEGTDIPVFECEVESSNEYTIAKAAQIHDNALAWLLATFDADEETLRNAIISRLSLQQGQKILVTGVGAGNDLPFLCRLIGKEGTIYAQDFSRQMLLTAAERVRSRYDLGDYDIRFSVSNAIDLPFCDDFFDAAYHFGGINLFENIAKGIAEMDRVVKQDGRVVFGDEGMAPWLRNTEYGKMLINNNPLCGFHPPLEHIPITARNVNFSWELGYYFYVIDYTVSKTDLPLNIDIPHLGKRGGTIRTRYLGRMEGISLSLKQQIYENAEKLGLSRVAYLESVLQKGLKEK